MYLDKIIGKVLCGEMDFDSIYDYCETMPDTPEKLLELKNAIEDYDLIDLYDCLFSRFGSRLTAEELSWYKKKYNRIFETGSLPFAEELSDHYCSTN